jgi:DNA-binding ferritin-like protein
MATRKRIQKHNTTRKNYKCDSKEKMIRYFMELLNMVKIYHWNTKSFSQHKATDELHERLSSNIDKFVEVMLGKDSSRLTRLEKKMRLMKIKNTHSLKQKMYEYRTYLIHMDKCLGRDDTDLLNIRDEILADVNQFLYLLTLE